MRMGLGEDFLYSFKRKWLQKLIANIDDGFCWRRGKGQMTNGHFYYSTDILTLNFPRNRTSAPQWTWKSILAPGTCVACRDTYLCSFRCAFCVGKLIIYLVYPYVKRNTKTIMGARGCFWNSAQQGGDLGFSEVIFGCPNLGEGAACI